MSADFDPFDSTVTLPRWVTKLARAVNVVHNPVTGWLVLAVSLAITVLAYFVASHQLNLRAQQQFEFRANEVLQAIDERMALYEQALRGGVGLFNSSDNVERSEWEAYVRSLDLASRLPGIQAMGFAIPLSPSAISEHVKRVRAEGFPDYQVTPPGAREEYSAIYMIEPFDWRNQRAFGFDMWSNAVRRKAMARARDQAVPSMSGVITLVQETNEDVQKGFLTYLPVYSAEMPQLPSKEEEVSWRREHFMGWVYAAFRGQDLIDGVLGSDDYRIHFSIYDATDAESVLFNDANLLYSSGNFDHLDNGVMEVTLPMDFQGRHWTVKFVGAQSLFLTKNEARQPNYILIAGVIVDLLLFYVIMSLHFINRHAASETKALKESQAKSIESLSIQTRIVEAIEHESHTFFEIAPDALLVVAPNGEIVKANQRAHSIFGYHDTTMVGLNIDTLVPDHVRDAHVQLREQYCRTPTPRIMGANRSLAAVKRSGEHFEVTINLVPLQLCGLMHTVAAIHDVTEQNEAKKALAAAKEKAEIANSSKSEFLANMSHEIRTPLNAVIGSAQLLENTHPTANQQKYVSMIRGSGETLLGIINDILDFSKVESGCMELSASPFDLDEVLERLAMMMGVNAGEKPIQLYIGIAPSVQRKLDGDSLRLQQVLINLASNAIKFTATGEVKVMITGDYDNTTGQQALNIVVSDTGIGMSPEQQGQLFKAFSQADGSITRRYGGTGLGLVISSRIVELMGGRIHVSSEEGVGTSFGFSVTLPVAELGVGDPLIVQASKRVAVVTEFDSASSVIDHCCAMWGWQAQTVSPSQVSRLEQADHTFDFCLIDIDCVDEAPDQLIGRLKNHGLMNASFVLLLSNHQRSLMLDDNLRSIVSSQVIKPLVARSLLAAFDESLSLKGELRLQPDVDSPDGPKKSLSGTHVLLVEDNVLNQTIALDVLADIGVTCEVANNGQEAIDTFSQASKPFDLILMDIQMPVMDGKTAARILKHERDCQVPIIAMTAGVLQSEQESYLLAGMDGFVPKPIDHGELYRVIKRFTVAKSDACESVVAQSTAAAGRRALNTNRLESLGRGRAERIKKLCQSLSVIIDTGDQRLREVEQAVLDGDIDQAKFTLHSLKGVAGNFGAEALQAELEQAEALVAAQNLKQVSERFDQMRDDLNAFLCEAKVWVDQHSDSA